MQNEVLVEVYVHSLIPLIEFYCITVTKNTIRICEGAVDIATANIFRVQSQSMQQVLKVLSFNILAKHYCTSITIVLLN